MGFVLAKRCNLGKSCGASCVQRLKKCEVPLGKGASETLSKMSTKVGVVVLFEQARDFKAPGFRAKFNQIGKELRRELGHQIRNLEDVREFEKRIRDAGLLPGEELDKDKKSGSDIPQEEWDRVSNPKDYDEKLSRVKLRREGDPKYNAWSESSAPGSSEAGAGSFATVTQNPGGEFVKRGILSENEAKILQKVGENDLGPKLIAADLNGRVKIEDNDPQMKSIEHFRLRNGRMAMTKVEGFALHTSAWYPEEELAGKPVSDIYWSTMSRLHRLGIAHNDAHPGNLLVETSTGKARWVDFGMAQDSPKAALAEAIGAFAIDSVSRTRSVVDKMPSDASGHFIAGNWQAKEWEVVGMRRAIGVKSPDDEKKLNQDLPILGKVRSNNIIVNRILRDKYGLDNDEIGAMYAHGIRSPIETFSQGPWAKITDSDARDLIEVFYEGV